jgi:hypothetical protein
VESRSSETSKQSSRGQHFNRTANTRTSSGPRSIGRIACDVHPKRAVRFEPKAVEHVGSVSADVARLRKPNSGIFGSNLSTRRATRKPRTGPSWRKGTNEAPGMPGKASLRPELGRVGHGFPLATCEEELWRQTFTSTYVHFKSFMLLNGSSYCVGTSPSGCRRIDLDKFLLVIGVNISFI